MARVTKTFTVSLLPDMFEELEEARMAEHRTRSELIREALRCYIALKRRTAEPVVQSGVHGTDA